MKNNITPSIADAPNIDLKAHKLFLEAKHLREAEALSELQLLWKEFKQKRYGTRRGNYGLG
tara:strand:- start:58 stop:240 length:183 start_codon:yes stop_codon:yes gene_type:complete